MIEGKTFSLSMLAAKVICAMAVTLVAWLAFAVPAHAVVIESPIDVSDDITRVHVDKLQAGTHEWVKGATMQIINAETGDVVDEWTTGEETHQLEKVLDVEVEYILREATAPEGYAKVDDVRFMVNATEGVGITILEPSDLGSAEWVELQDVYKIVLYDTLAEEQVEYKDRPSTATSTARGTSSTAKTGDQLPMGLIIAIAATAAAASAIARKRLT